MDRRKFLTTLIGGVAASAAVRTFPFRVFSFPKEIKVRDWAQLGDVFRYNERLVQAAFGNDFVEFSKRHSFLYHRRDADGGILLRLHA
jgi:hypothetical protein